MIDFDKAFDKLFAHEGGYVNDPKDPGGETRFGISKRSYPGENIKTLTRDRAKELYERDFWQPVVEMNVSAELRFHVFDMAVNSGLQNAVKCLQRMGGVPRDQQDGVYGPFTAKCLRNVPDEKAVEWFNGWRLMFYTDLVSFDHFGKGWAKRIARNLLIGAPGVGE